MKKTEIKLVVDKYGRKGYVVYGIDDPHPMRISATDTHNLLKDGKAKMVSNFFIVDAKRELKRILNDIERELRIAQANCNPADAHTQVELKIAEIKAHAARRVAEELYSALVELHYET